MAASCIFITQLASGAAGLAPPSAVGWGLRSQAGPAWGRAGVGGPGQGEWGCPTDHVVEANQTTLASRAVMSRLRAGGWWGRGVGGAKSWRLRKGS